MSEAQGHACLQANTRDAAATHSTELLEAYSGLAEDAVGLLEDFTQLAEALAEQNAAGGGRRHSVPAARFGNLCWHPWLAAFGLSWVGLTPFRHGSWPCRLQP
jgi:hypothetical protein